MAHRNLEDVRQKPIVAGVRVLYIQEVYHSLSLMGSPDKETPEIASMQHLIKNDFA